MTLTIKQEKDLTRLELKRRQGLLVFGLLALAFSAVVFNSGASWVTVRCEPGASAVCTVSKKRLVGSSERRVEGVLGVSSSVGAADSEGHRTWTLQLDTKDGPVTLLYQNGPSKQDPWQSTVRRIDDLLSGKKPGGTVELSDIGNGAFGGGCCGLFALIAIGFGVIAVRRPDGLELDDRARMVRSCQLGFTGKAIPYKKVRGASRVEHRVTLGYQSQRGLMTQALALRLDDGSQLELFGSNNLTPAEVDEMVKVLRERLELQG